MQWCQALGWVWSYSAKTGSSSHPGLKGHTAADRSKGSNEQARMPGADSLVGAASPPCQEACLGSVAHV